MTDEHYFSAAPTGPERRREISFRAFGRDLTVQTANGVFAGGGLDKGTAVLLRTIQPEPATRPGPEVRILDLGCGWGAIALSLALALPQARIDAIDVNDRALELCADNAVSLGVADRVRVLRPEEVPSATRYAQIWSNPPIRIGKSALHALLLDWLPRLEPAGVAHLVVSRNLGADTLATWLTAQAFDCQRVASANGFRVLTVRP